MGIVIALLAMFGVATAGGLPPQPTPVYWDQGVAVKSDEPIYYVAQPQKKKPIGRMTRAEIRAEVLEYKAAKCDHVTDNWPACLWN